MKTYKEALRGIKKLSVGSLISYPQNISGRDVCAMFVAKGIHLETAHYTDDDVKVILEKRTKVPFGIYRVKAIDEKV